MNDNTLTAFKKCHNRWRRRPRQEDGEKLFDDEELIDFDSESERCSGVELILLPKDTVGDRYLSGARVYGLKAYPGFFFFPNALSNELQEALALAALDTYCESPHRTNIDAVSPIRQEEEESNGIWDSWRCERDQKTRPQSTNSKRSLRKLSWATLGYHYDWTARAYHEEAKSPMPGELSQLGSHFARIALRLLGEAETSFEATACIVNYYNEKSVMGGHRDDLETVNKPIVSLSIGRPAILLLGGPTLDDTPVVPILVRTGDVMVMAGDCRLNYHSMARLLPAKHNKRLRDSTAAGLPLQDFFSEHSRRSKEERADFTAFVAENRININVRQVY